MALLPLNAAAPAPASGGMAAAPDAPAMDDANKPMVFATIMKLPDGKFLLVDGDEPDDEMGEDEPGMMDQSGVDGPALLKQLMAKMEGDQGAEDSFGKGVRGEPDATAAKPSAPMPG